MVEDDALAGVFIHAEIAIDRLRLQHLGSRRPRQDDAPVQALDAQICDALTSGGVTTDGGVFATSRGMSRMPPLHAIKPLAGALGFAFAASVAIAADYATRDVGPWVVASSSDGQGCFLTRTYPSPRATTVQFGLDIDGSNRLTLLNANWSIQERERLRLTFRFSDAAFPRHLAVGIASEGKKGFVTSFGAAFPRTFATSNIPHVKRGDVPVEELELDGSGAAVAELNKCVNRSRATATPKPVREEKGRIPLDPFAGKGTRDSRLDESVSIGSALIKPKR